MNIIAIPDVHGRTNWKLQIGDPEQWDKIIFLGDYVDYKGKHIPYNIINNNLRDIITLQKNYPDKVIMLVGNHDIQYIWHPKFGCSGFVRDALDKYQTTFIEAKLQASYQVDNYIFTHAGISNKWMNLKFTKMQFSSHAQDGDTLSDTLNRMITTENGRCSLFEIGELRGGWAESGGVCWADQLETQNDLISDYHQIVGHTNVKDIIKFEFSDINASITYCDTLSEKAYILKL